MRWTAPIAGIAMCQISVAVAERRESGHVKGCRTPAVAGCLPRARLAGVGQASGEETAGRQLDKAVAITPEFMIGLLKERGFVELTAREMIPDITSLVLATRP